MIMIVKLQIVCIARNIILVQTTFLYFLIISYYKNPKQNINWLVTIIKNVENSNTF